jgi:hypothetical protein
MIDVGIACDDDDIAAIPAQGVHFGAAGGQERRRLDAGAIRFGTEKQGGSGLHARD